MTVSEDSSKRAKGSQDNVSGRTRAKIIALSMSAKNLFSKHDSKPDSAESKPDSKENFLRGYKFRESYESLKNVFKRSKKIS